MNLELSPMLFLHEKNTKTRDAWRKDYQNDIQEDIQEQYIFSLSVFNLQNSCISQLLLDSFFKTGHPSFALGWLRNGNNLTYILSVKSK